MKVGSLFAGIGGFDLGFERAGFTVAWCVEWDKNAQAVLRKRFPNAKVYGDIREVDPDSLEPVDIVCGGFPCQDLSVAGKRAGLAGERSGLFHDAMRIVRRLNPRLLVLENVPGLLSSNRGLDFATVLREVGEGWDCAEVGWRVLDSQYFGVAQRRRRVFIVGSARTGCAEEILALAESSGGNPPSRGKAREGTSADAARCADLGRKWPAEVAPTLNCAYADKMGLEDQHALNGAGHFVPQIVGALTARGTQTLGSSEVDGNHYVPCSATWWDGSDCAATLTKNNANGGQRMPDKGNLGAVVQAFRKSKRAQTASDDETWVDDGLANTLKIGSSLGIPSPPAVAFAQNQVGEIRTSETMSIIGTTGNESARTTPKIISGMVVRRLTPVECERLQGFPDGWTDIGTDKPTAGSHRYKQLGNAVTVNVAEWIARRAKAALESNQ